MKALRFTSLLFLSLAVAASGFAQKPRHGVRKMLQSQIDTAQTVVVEGVVVQFVAGPGQGLPQLQVEDGEGQVHTFVLGPFWHLEEHGFVADPGDSVTITGFPCSACEHDVVVAEVVNSTKGITLTLRDANGAPLWRGEHVRPCQGEGPGSGVGRGSGKGPGKGGGGPHGQGMLVPDLGQLTTFAGTVASFAAELCEGPGTLVLTTATGEVSFVLSPMMVLIRAEFEPAVGDALEITAAPATTADGDVWLALVIKDTASGLELVLRDPSTGLPFGGHTRGGRR